MSALPPKADIPRRELNVEFFTLEVRQAGDIDAAFEALRGQRRGRATNHVSCAGICRSGRSDVLRTELDVRRSHDGGLCDITLRD